MKWARRKGAAGAAAVFFWAVLLSLSLAAYLSSLETHAHNIAFGQAHMLFDVLKTARLWNAEHGDVFVPVSKTTQPNPYLSASDRDIQIAGREFTKVNPSYMTRQIADIVAEKEGVVFRISGLEPIRPENAADPWEAEALALFEDGEKKYAEHLKDQDPPIFRYMEALYAEESCLSCHAAQGYKVGDVQGGISVSIPEARVMAAIIPHRNLAIALHLGLFIVLSAVTLYVLQRMHKNWEALGKANVQLAEDALERRRIAERLEETVGDLERSNKDLQDFAYVISHDLREPLRMVTSYLGLIRKRYEDKLDENANEFIHFAVDGASRMSAMIQDLLQLSRVQTRARENVPVDMRKVVDEALVNLSILISESSAEVVAEGDYPIVCGDDSQLIRVFQNLIANSIKYRSPERRPKIKISVKSDRIGDKDVWVFSVSDNGVGVVPKDFERIFMIFTRLEKAKGQDGTGIGLAVVKKIIERHEGRIWLESQSGKGSTFFFSLPS